MDLGHEVRSVLGVECFALLGDVELAAWAGLSWRLYGFLCGFSAVSLRFLCGFCTMTKLHQKYSAHLYTQLPCPPSQPTQRSDASRKPSDHLAPEAIASNASCENQEQSRNTYRSYSTYSASLFASISREKREKREKWNSTKKKKTGQRHWVSGHKELHLRDLMLRGGRSHMSHHSQWIVVL